MPALCLKFLLRISFKLLQKRTGKTAATLALVWFAQKEQN